jgi:hypothetical protein
MASGPKMRRTLEGVRHGVGALVRLPASLKLTVALLVLLAAVLGCAGFVESAKGREYVQWFVYNRGWFIGLLGALAANIAAATWVRVPRPWSRPGFGLALVLAPVGLLVVLAGCIQTLVQGIEGRLMLFPGETTQTVMLTHRSQLTLLSPRGKEVQSTELGFSPGPVDWRSNQPLDFGNVDGRAIKVLRFYRHARYQPEWVADDAGLEKPAILVAASDARGGESRTLWYVPVLFGGPPPPGQLNVSIAQASVPSLLDDFLQPPKVQPASRGVLSAHYKDRVYTFPVDGNIGKTLPVGDSGLTVEIVESYANAKLKKDQFISEGNEPKNPMLRLRVRAPGQKEPISEIAYANQPFVNYESTRKQACPVKFWYHHPATTAATGAEFLQTPDGRLYCRVGANGTFQARGEVKAGDRIPISNDSQVSLLHYIPHARREETFVPIEPAPGKTGEEEAAALVELTTDGKSERFWLRRNDAQLGVRKLQGPGAELVVMFGYERRPLGFSLKLVDFHRDANPVSPDKAACVSQVNLSQGTQNPDVTAANHPLRVISTNRPLRYGAFTFHQSGFQQVPARVDLSVLRVTSDPGRFLKYAGGAMICGGIVFLLWQRAFRRRPMGPSPLQGPER